MHADVCTINGLLEISNDGHSYVGILHIDAGGCVNVSVPEREARRMSDKPARRVTVTGRVLPYVHENTFVEYRVNGRQIGYGLCGDHFLFVK